MARRSENATASIRKIERIDPILCVRDIPSSVAFYREALGFTEAEWGDENFTSVGKDNCSIYLCRNSQGNAGTWVWIGFDGDIFELHDRLIGKGVKILQPPINYSWALEIHIEDPDGHVLRLGTDPDINRPFVEKH
jgi:predicted lactoylglutathione lyase